jgi:hypothetical protein
MLQATGFFLPFGVAGKSIVPIIPSSIDRVLTVRQSGSSRRTNRRCAVDTPPLARLQRYYQNAGPSFRMYIIVTLNSTHVYEFNFAFQPICCAHPELFVVTYQLDPRTSRQEKRASFRLQEFFEVR